VDHLADAGHREAIFVTWPEEIFRSGRTYAERFRDSTLAEASRRGLRLEEIACPTGPDHVREALRAALGRAGAPRTILVHNDAAVAMLPMVLHDLDLQVPRDRSVVSLHSAELGRLYALPYTAVESEPERVSSLAVEMLVRRIAEPGDRAAVSTLVTPRLMLRDSVLRVGD